MEEFKKLHLNVSEKKHDLIKVGIFNIKYIR